MGVDDDGKLLLPPLLLLPVVDMVGTSAGGFTHIMRKANMAIEVTHPRHRVGRGIGRCG
jgi:hypothetical protein